MSEFYKTITYQIEVSVRPEFANMALQDKDSFLWHYFVKIKNNGANTIQIIRRYWRIVNEDGTIEEVYGEGVVGKQPVLRPQLEFEYDSQVQLKHPSGIMSGYYEVKQENGAVFRVQIPKFSLDMPGKRSIIN